MSSSIWWEILDSIQMPAGKCPARILAEHCSRPPRRISFPLTGFRASCCSREIYKVVQTECWPGWEALVPYAPPPSAVAKKEEEIAQLCHRPKSKYHWEWWKRQRTGANIAAKREDASPSYGGHSLAKVIKSLLRVISRQKEGLIRPAWKVLMKWSEGSEWSIIQLEKGDVFGDKILMEPLPSAKLSREVVKSQFYDPYKIDELSTTRDP